MVGYHALTSLRARLLSCACLLFPHPLAFPIRASDFHFSWRTALSSALIRHSFPPHLRTGCLDLAQSPPISFSSTTPLCLTAVPESFRSQSRVGPPGTPASARTLSRLASLFPFLRLVLQSSMRGWPLDCLFLLKGHLYETAHTLSLALLFPSIPLFWLYYASLPVLEAPQQRDSAPSSHHSPRLRILSRAALSSLTSRPPFGLLRGTSRASAPAVTPFSVWA